jgi:glycosyltransferase involved in cell wall biosynthesis
MHERSISFHPAAADDEPVFSILIPSWNNLAYLKTCVASIQKNSRYRHEIIVHLNEAKDGSRAWVEEQGLAHTFSEKNVGVCYGFNAPASLARAHYLVLSDDDYYFAPEWDVPLYDEIKKLNTIYFCLTGTMIEHSATQYPESIIAPFDFGKTVDQFNEERFLADFAEIPFHDWTGGNWYPLVLHKHVWNLIGGLSTEFTPGMASDPDMMMKLWHAGVRYYKGLSASRVYHFGSKSTARVKKNDGNKQFLLKWGLSKSTFFQHYLRLGQLFEGETLPPDESDFKFKLVRDRWKRKWSVWRKD